ncbi:MAG: DegQ family serine endoprotease [Pseudomonadota bacterium]|nr:DegQ family serine endoprotease [Pseudomonadota bacterium]
MRPFFALILGLSLTLSPAAVSAQTPTTVVPESRAQVTMSFAPLVKQVAPAVVNIYTEKKIQQRVSPLFDDPFFRQFFGGNLGQGFTRQRLENALGSGVIVRPDGLIITSNHVIAGADQIRVVLSDRREFDASLVLADERADLAVLRIDVKNERLPYLGLKDSDEAQVGDLVLAIGDPFGVGQTVTNGIISAVARGATGSTDLDYYIQTDAAINPGNSGGALVTMDGKLVGINASIYSRSGGNLGIGFAVPSNMVRVVLDAVAQGKKATTHPWFGIDGQDITPELAASMNMAQPAGVLVNNIHSASPAGKAGLRVGDVIVSVDGKPVDDLGTFRYRIATRPVGDTANLGIVRKGQKTDIQTVLIAPPEDPPRDRTEVKGRNPFAGAILENLSPAVIEETGVRGAEHGVVVIDVKEDSAAASIGLQPGDIVLSINNGKVADVQDVATAPASRGGWRIKIERGDNVISVMVGG